MAEYALSSGTGGARPRQEVAAATLAVLPCPEPRSEVRLGVTGVAGRPLGAVKVSTLYFGWGGCPPPTASAALPPLSNGGVTQRKVTGGSGSGGGGGGRGSGRGSDGATGAGPTRAHGCNLCPHRFKRVCDLKKHKAAVHAKLRPFACRECGKTFGQAGTRSKHYRTVHVGLKPHCCGVCERTFSEKGNMRKHMLRVHRTGPLAPLLPVAAPAQEAGHPDGGGEK